MPERNDHPHGMFCWVDLNSHDMEAAARWYGRLLGWTCEIERIAGPPYGMFLQDGRPVAGIGQMSDEMKAQGVPPLWNSYVRVDDASVIEKRVVELGGEVVFPSTAMGNAGTLAFFRDPSGASFAAWQPGTHRGAAVVGDPGSFCWNELVTTDVVGSKTFYGELFGWTFRSDGGQPVEYNEICVGNRANGGIVAPEPEGGPIAPSWRVYFAVADIEASVATATETGGRVLLPPTSIENVGRFAVVRDPQGGVFSLIRLAAPGT